MAKVYAPQPCDVTLDMRMPPHDVTIRENLLMLRKIVSRSLQEPMKAQLQTLRMEAPATMSMNPVPAMHILQESLTTAIADNVEGELTPHKMALLGRCLSPDADASIKVASGTDANASIASTPNAQISRFTNCCKLLLCCLD